MHVTRLPKSQQLHAVNGWILKLIETMNHSVSYHPNRDKTAKTCKLVLLAHVRPEAFGCQSRLVQKVVYSN